MMNFYLLFLRDRFIMGFHGVDLLRFSVKLSGLTTLEFASGVGLFVFVWPLRGILVRVILQYFTLL